MDDLLDTLDRERPVLIAGPTASGKSGLAMEIAARHGGIVVNADSMQVYSGWRLLTARPSAEDEAAVPHALYGHVPNSAPYSAGHWLRDVTPLLDCPRPIIVGGTGLNFAALSEGLAEIPETPPEVRARADATEIGVLLADLDAPTRKAIDTANPARVRRAWEVLTATGRGLAEWQGTKTRALLPLSTTQPILLNAPPEWLTPRIAQRFDIMVKNGVLDEVAARMDTWDPTLPSSRAIGAQELVAHLRGEMSLDAARERIVILTRQYAKRQRTWFRARMRTWQRVDLG